MFPYQWIEAAAERIRPHLLRTPLTYDPQEELYIKWENHQVSGSFKPRGAINKVLALQPWEQERGLVAASAGNHGQGVALAGKLVGARVLVFASEAAVPAKIQAMKAMGAEVRLVPGGYGEAEKAALEHCAAHDLTWVSPYNDAQVIAGQGTLALEILSEMETQGEASLHSGQTWVVPAGGGGLLSGIGIALKEGPGQASRNDFRVVGAQSEASSFLHRLFYTGSQREVVELPSLADGLAGPVEEGSLTIALCRGYADEFVLVSEAEVRQAIR
jgi:threonine dehydratase